MIAATHVQAGYHLHCKGNAQNPKLQNIEVDCKNAGAVVKILGASWETLRRQKSQFEDTCWEAYEQAKESAAQFQNQTLSDVSRGWFARCNMGLATAAVAADEGTLRGKQDVIIAYDCKTTETGRIINKKYVKNSNKEFGWKKYFEVGNRQGQLFILANNNEVALSSSGQIFELHSQSNGKFAEYKIPNGNSFFKEFINSDECKGAKTRFTLEDDQLYQGYCVVTKNILSPRCN